MISMCLWWWRTNWKFWEFLTMIKDYDRSICTHWPPRESGFSPSSPSWPPCCRMLSSGKNFYSLLSSLSHPRSLHQSYLTHKLVDFYWGCFAGCWGNIGQQLKERHRLQSKDFASVLQDDKQANCNWTKQIKQFQLKLFIPRRNAERKAKRGSYELRGLQNLGYNEHRWK